MKEIATRLNAYIKSHPFDAGDSSCKTVLDQLYQAYAESHESDPEEIGDGFKELEEYLHTLPLKDNNAVSTAISDDARLRPQALIWNTSGIPMY